VNILFFMSHPGQARNFESTLCGLAERGHRVHLAFDRTGKRNLPGVSDLADSLVAEYPGLTAGHHPRPPKTDWSWVSGRLRASLDYMRYLEPEFRDAPKLRRRATQWPPMPIERVVATAPPPARSGLRSALRLAVHSAP